MDAENASDGIIYGPTGVRYIVGELGPVGYGVDENAKASIDARWEVSDELAEYLRAEYGTAWNRGPDLGESLRYWRAVAEQVVAFIRPQVEGGEVAAGEMRDLLRAQVRGGAT